MPGEPHSFMSSHAGPRAPMRSRLVRWQLGNLPAICTGRWSWCGLGRGVPHHHTQLSRLRWLSQQTTPRKIVMERGISQTTGRRGDTVVPSAASLQARALEFHQKSLSESIFTSFLCCSHVGGDNEETFCSASAGASVCSHLNSSLCGNAGGCRLRLRLADPEPSHSPSSVLGCDVFTFGQTGETRRRFLISP